MYYTFLRCVQQLTVLTAGAVVVMALAQVPIYPLMGILFVTFLLFCKRTVHLSAHGTARWADASDLKGMIE